MATKETPEFTFRVTWSINNHPGVFIERYELVKVSTTRVQYKDTFGIHHEKHSDNTANEGFQHFFTYERAKEFAVVRGKLLIADLTAKMSDAEASIMHLISDHIYIINPMVPLTIHQVKNIQL